MKPLIALLGAVLGVALGHLPGGLAMGLLGALAAWRWGDSRTSAAMTSGIDAATLLRRIIALEQQVSTLRATVADLRGGAPTATPESEVPRASPVADDPVATRHEVAPEPVVLETPPPPVASTPPAPSPAVAPTRRPPIAPPQPAVPLRDRLPPFVARFVFGGNTIVKIGVLILFLGLAFLLRYTADHVAVPVEFRYVGVALVGVALTSVGWRLRDRQDAAGGTGYGLILQGAGIGALYLTTLGALRLNPLLPPGLAFAFLALVAVFGAVLAVLQDAPWLALVSVAEGFAAPVLVSTGSDAYVPLMSYVAILDAGILAMAWFKAWRPLNLVGAVATFALAGAWAHAHYAVADYAGVQAFLVLFFLLFTLTGVLFARRALAAGDTGSDERPLAERAADALRELGRVDSTLTFGVPLAAFSLQYLLVRDMAWGPAWAAASFALFHIALGGALMRGAQPRYALLGEAHVIVGSIFATLAVPLALQQGAWTGATWSIEAAGMYWLGARQRRTYARAFALLVMLGAALGLVNGLTPDWRAGVPLIAGSKLGIAMFAVALCAMDLVRRQVIGSVRGQVEELAATTVPSAAAFAFATLAWMLCPMSWGGAIVAWIACGAAASAGRLAAPSLRVASALLHLAALTAMTLSLRLTAVVPPQAWQDLVAALLIGAALLATGWLGLRGAWRDAAAGTPRPVPLGSSIGLVLGLTVASASLLFELAPAEAARAWPLIGLAAAWIGLRLRSGALVGSGLALQVVAAATSLAFERSIWSLSASRDPIAATLWTPLLLATAGLCIGEQIDRCVAAPARAWWQSRLAQWALLAWTLLWWSRVLPPVVWRELMAAPAPGALQAWQHWQAIWVTLTALAALAIARWRDWRVLGQATLLAVPAWIALALGSPEGALPSAQLGWLAWPLALLAHPLLLRLQDRWRPAVLTTPLLAAGNWLFVALATQEGARLVRAVTASGSAWQALATAAVPAIVLAASLQPVLQRRMKTPALRTAWLGVGCGGLALALFGWLWLSLSDFGATNLSPWLPLLNPLELGQGIAALAVLAWLRAIVSARLPPRFAPLLAATLGATAFALVTAMVLRSCAHWAGIAWNADALCASKLAQAALSVAWSLIGVTLMLAGHRGARRVTWAVGAALLGIVVAKLFLVELADHGGLSRVVSFMVVGGLMLAVGYFAPIPPRRDAESGRPRLGEAA